MSRSPITIDDEWLSNEHAGALLVSEFMEPLGLAVDDVAAAISLPSDRLIAVIDGRKPVDAELDLRLGRYFKMSEGFFLRLQNQYELLEVKRARGSDIARVMPRAA